MLVERIDGDEVEGRVEQQGPEVDGTTTVGGLDALTTPVGVGDLVRARVTGSSGVDLLATALPQRAG